MRGKQIKEIKKGTRGASPEPNSPKARKALNSFAWTFLMAAALTVIPVSLIPEAWYRPLNQLTASLAGNLIRQGSKKY